MPLGTEVGLNPSNIVLDRGPSFPSPKKGTEPPNWAHVYCVQTAGWIKIPLGMEVGLGPGHIVVDGNPSPKMRAQPQIFGPYLLWPNGWMDEDATW